MEQEKMSQNIEDILKTVEFLKDNMMSREEGVTKTDLQRTEDKMRDDLQRTEDKMRDDLQRTEDKMRDDLHATEDRMIGHVDAFVGMHQKLDTELTALRSKVDRLEEQLQTLQRQVQANPA